MAVKFYEEVDDDALLKFAVIIARTEGKYVFCKHKLRDTLEVPGGHREPGERILDTAKRELYEETGAVDFDIWPICVYSVIAKDNFDGQETFGMLYYAEIRTFEQELHSEIEKIMIMNEMPANWTYPDIQPKLMQEAWRRGFLEKNRYKRIQGGERMSEAVVVLKKGEGRSLKAGGLWVYDNEIDTIMGTFRNGDIVAVHDFDGYMMGRGFINQNSKIRVRMMTRHKDQQIDRAFLKMRVREAWEYRKKTVDTSSCRVVFGEADFLPGIVIDKFSDVLVVESLALGIDRLKPDIIACLKEVLADDGICIRGVYERSDAKVRVQEGMERFKGFIGEAFDTNVEITENGVRYLVDVKDGQKTGFFLDQKYNRLAIQKLCRGAKVLDCFTHTGSFALNAGIAGAESVLGVDASESAITQAVKNAALNGLQDIVKFQCADVFDFLPKLEEAGEQYDVVILDPPAFTKSRNSVKNAIKGYREINMRGMKLVKDGGFLATCSCSHFMDYALFTQTIAQAAKSVHCRLRQVEYRTQSADHPILWNAEESYYLKFYIFQVRSERKSGSCGEG